jgi:hypothetical protein
MTMNKKVTEVVKRGPGRPKGSKNKPKTLAVKDGVLKFKLDIKVPRANTTNNKVLKFDLTEEGYKLLNKYSTYKYKKRYNELHKYIVISENPTGNCQLSSVAYFYNILLFVKKLEDILKPKNVKFEITNLKSLIKTIRCVNYGKRILFLDIRDNYLSGSKKLLKSLGVKIITHTPYKSTNGSPMNILLVDINNISYAANTEYTFE